MEHIIRRILAILIAIGFISSLVILIPRFHSEWTNRNVEIVCDWNECTEWAYRNSLTQEELLRRLHSAKIQSVAVRPETLSNLSSTGKCSVLNGFEIQKLVRIGSAGVTFSKWTPTKDLASYTFVVTEDFPLGKRIREALEAMLGTDQLISATDGTRLFLGIRSVLPEDILSIPLFFSSSTLEQIANAKLGIVLRLKNGSKSIGSTYAIPWEDADGIIFEGQDIPGFPETRGLQELVDSLSKHKLWVGAIDFSPQNGMEYLVQSIPSQIVRVFSIGANEWLESAKNSALRAVRERNIRVLYLHLDSQGPGPEIHASPVIRTLTDAKWTVGKASPVVIRGQPTWVSIVLRLAALAGVWFVVHLLFPVPYWLDIAALTGFIVSEVFQSNYVLSAQTYSFALTLVFPILAVLFILWVPRQKNKLRGQSALRTVQVTGITLIGAVLIAGLLSLPDFASGIFRFHGVRLAIGIPLFFGFFLFYFSEELNLRKILASNISVLDLLILGVLAGISYFLIVRSGNTAGALTGHAEVNVRSVLETTLIARPRFKEFLIGYPCMLIGCYLFFKKARYAWPFLLLGIIGQISILNTFCHAHSPLWISLLRTANGLWLGFALGAIALLCLPKK
jgi:hypothetical protein